MLAPEKVIFGVKNTTFIPYTEVIIVHPNRGIFESEVALWIITLGEQVRISFHHAVMIDKRPTISF